MAKEDALSRLKQGNEAFARGESHTADVSLAVRAKTATDGQHPFAVVIACADSRVIPEEMFDTGIGDLFVIRVAGNIVGSFELGSIEYAVGHLGVKLIVVLGHDGCGAVQAALNRSGGKYIRIMTDEIRTAIGEEKNADRACCLNVAFVVNKIKRELVGVLGQETTVLGAKYRLSDGSVEFFEQKES